MPKLTSGNRIVDEMAEISIKGNVIPQEWYKHVVRKNGKPHLLAISILGDVVYWHRPTELRDEATGYIIGWRKKFKGDRLQKSYKYYSNMFGESKDSIKVAFDVLEEMGVLERDFEQVEHDDGTYSSNVMYIRLNPSKLRDITFGYDESGEPSEEDPEEISDEADETKGDIPEKNQGVPPKFSGRVPKILDHMGGNKRGTTPSERDTLPENFPPYPPEKPETYTNTKTNNTTEINNRDYFHSFSSITPSEDDIESTGLGSEGGNERRDNVYLHFGEIIAENIDFDGLKNDYPANKVLIERILKVLTDTVCSAKTELLVAKQLRPISEVRKVYLGLRREHIEHVLLKLPEDDSNIAQKDKFLMAYLFNAPETIEQICKVSGMHEKKSGNKIHNFKERRYDIEALERELIGK